jgi:hypothetical protein
MRVDLKNRYEYSGLKCAVCNEDLFWDPVDLEFLGHECGKLPPQLIPKDFDKIVEAADIETP